jgi:hypothetical protein
MASTAPLRLLTPRDLEILTALDHCPLTARQLLKLSRTFDYPFPNERRVRDRLQALGDSGRVRLWQYATASRGAPNYYTLSPLGYRLLHGEGAIPPTKRAFSPVGIAQQHHTQSLADFIVHTAVAAHAAGVRFTGFYRENTLRLAVGDECLYPDCGFQLVRPDGSEFGFVVEVDAGTERIRSPKDLDSWERKIRLYDRFQDACPRRFRVLIVSTRSTVRVEHILEAAATLVRNPHRALFYGVSLPAYLAQDEAITTPCFRGHRGEAIALVPRTPGAGARDEPKAALTVA